MTSPRVNPPIFTACVMSGHVGSVVLAGGSRFPIKAAADEALGVEVAVTMTSIAAGVEVEVMEAGAGVTRVEPVAVAADVDTGERVIGVGEAVALGHSVGVRDTVAVELGVSVGTFVGSSTGIGSEVAGASGKGVFVGNTSTRDGFVGGSPMRVLVGNCATTLA